ncbi:MAG: class I mannose-6-phosphate isomerase [Myxococcales bacterium]|nr:class I mannose-6-phosphate isomerase [Myxococcales bacterium]
MADFPKGAWILQPDNFTPPTRTPWGGQRILQTYKAPISDQLAESKRGFPVVGESWEISVEPSFPSHVRTDAGMIPLAELIARDSDAVLGDAARYGGLSLLVKLLDAALPLSVQVHPTDDYPALAQDECGKPESWYIVAASPGAGLYLGFKEGVSAREVEDALRSERDLSDYLNFVPVEPGDCFEIGPGTIHAIGGGVTLVEPQQVIPGKKGITYRFWDWNRRYDASGPEDPAGSPRQLHIHDSMAVTDFEGLRGEAFVESVRRRPTLLAQSRDGDARLCGYIESSAFEVCVFTGSRGAIELPTPRFWAGVVVAGEAQLNVSDEQSRVRRGQSFVIPAFHSGVTVEALLPGTEIVFSAPGGGAGL